MYTCYSSQRSVLGVVLQAGWPEVPEINLSPPTARVPSMHHTAIPGFFYGSSWDWTHTYKASTLLTVVSPALVLLNSPFQVPCLQYVLGNIEDPNSSTCIKCVCLSEGKQDFFILTLLLKPQQWWVLYTKLGLWYSTQGVSMHGDSFQLYHV